MDTFCDVCGKLKLKSAKGNVICFKKQIFRQCDTSGNIVSGVNYCKIPFQKGTPMLEFKFAKIIALM